jgi:hypothetical protein
MLILKTGSPQREGSGEWLVMEERDEGNREAQGRMGVSERRFWERHMALLPERSFYPLELFRDEPGGLRRAHFVSTLCEALG